MVGWLVWNAMVTTAHAMLNMLNISLNKSCLKRNLSCYKYACLKRDSNLQPLDQYQMLCH